MNTDPVRGIDLAAGTRALEAVEASATREALCAAMDRLASALDLPHFLMLHLHGAENEVVSVLHNLPGRQAVDVILNPDAMQRALSSTRIPQVLVGELGLREFDHAIAAMWQHGMTTCVLVLGRASAWAIEHTTDLLGFSSLASSYAATALASALKADCPFTDRELECLIFAAAGSSAKETSRHLKLSPRTVEEYLYRCKDRLGLRTSLAAAATAVQRGWITFEEIDAASDAINPRYGADRK